MSKNFKPHLFVKNVHSSQEYTTPPGPPINIPLPVRERTNHGNALLNSLSQIWATHNLENVNRQEAGLPFKDGFTI